MRVELGEVEFSGDEEENGANGLEPAVVPDLALGRLEQPVKRFDEAVSLARARPGGDAVDVSADHLRDRLHGLDLRAIHVGAPLVQHGLDDVDLPSVENRPELVPVHPGPCSAFPRDLRDERVETGALSRADAGGILEQRPPQVLEFGVETLFDAGGRVERPGSVGDDMELVEGDLGVGQVLRDALDERRRHVDGNRSDRLRVAAAGGISRHRAITSASKSSVNPEHRPAQGGSTNATRPSGNRTRGTRALRSHSCWKKLRWR